MKQSVNTAITVTIQNVTGAIRGQFRDLSLSHIDVDIQRRMQSIGHPAKAWIDRTTRAGKQGYGMNLH